MRSSSSLGVVFIALGGIAVSPLGARAPLTPAGLTIAALLVVAGVLLLLRRSFAFWAALAAALATVLSGVLALGGLTRWALPVPGGLSIGVGLYLILRAFIARSSLGPQPPRALVPKDEE